MQYNPQKHHRKSIRLKGYDYAQAGLYFITICTQNRACLFGEITNDKMILNDAGKMIASQWLHLKQRFTNIEIHEFITMPNHFHGIIKIVGATLVVDPNNNNNRQPQGIAPTDKTIGEIIGAFKSITTNEYIQGVKSLNWQRFDGKLWQRNYYERIIRGQKAYLTISNYIINNPQNWKNNKLQK